MIFDKFKTINELTSVCIIAKSNNARFNFLERYVYNNIAKLFAKDLISNFIFLFTFCDNQEPLSLAKFNEPNSFLYNIKIKINKPWYLKFNNSGFFPDKPNKFTEDFFELGIDSFKKLIIKLKPLKKCSLKLSNEINEKRTKLDELYVKIKDNLVKLKNPKNYNFSGNSNFNYILSNEEKKEIYKNFYNCEKCFENYNNNSLKESEENLIEFLKKIIDENNLNENKINDLISKYYDIKKRFMYNKNHYKTFENFLNYNYL